MSLIGCAASLWTTFVSRHGNRLTTPSSTRGNIKRSFFKNLFIYFLSRWSRTLLCAAEYVEIKSRMINYMWLTWLVVFVFVFVQTSWRRRRVKFRLSSKPSSCTGRTKADMRPGTCWSAVMSGYKNTILHYIQYIILLHKWFSSH